MAERGNIMATQPPFTPAARKAEAKRFERLGKDFGKRKGTLKIITTLFHTDSILVQFSISKFNFLATTNDSQTCGVTQCLSKMTHKCRKYIM